MMRGEKHGTDDNQCHGGLTCKAVCDLCDRVWLV